MKRKNDLLEIVTKGFFKGELKKELDGLEKRLDGKIEKRIEMAEKVLRIEIIASTLDARQRLEKKLSEATDKIFTRIDPLLGETLTAREDRTITTHNVTELQEQVGEHEERITKLETAKIAA